MLSALNTQSSAPTVERCSARNAVGQTETVRLFAVDFESCYMTNGSKFRKHVHEDDRPPRICSSCRAKQPVKGGRWVEFNGGYNRRWVCERCYQVNGEHHESD